MSDFKENPATKSRFDLIGTLALATTILLTSMVPPMLKSFTPYLDGWTTNGIRYPFSCLIMMIPLAYQYGRGKVNPRLWVLALVPTFFNIIGQTLWAWIPYYLSASMMGFLVRISVLFSLAGGLICFSDERQLIRKWVFWVGGFLSILGFVFMSLMGSEPPRGDTLIGVIMVLFCGANYGLYGVTVRYSLKGSRPWEAFPVISLYTSVAMILLAWMFGDYQQLFGLEVWRFGFVLLSSFIGIAAAHTTFYIAIERLGIAISGGTQLLCPFFTTLWAFLFFGEMLTILQWVGGFVLLVGGGLLISAQTSLPTERMAVKEAPIEPRVPD